VAAAVSRTSLPGVSAGCLALLAGLLAGLLVELAALTIGGTPYSRPALAPSSPG
jgi:hypothetical protein